MPSTGGDESEVESWRSPVQPADLLISLALVLATFAAYSRVVRYGFITLDDPVYVYQNPYLRGGLTWQTLKWAFLSFNPDYWFPVTRLSLWTDYHLFGLRPGVYHAENILIHSLSAVLLFGFLRRATRVRWPCAFVACMFALHPLHVESVAWIAERKDVLYAFFWFAALWAWLLYTERPRPGRYIGALVLFSLGLMSKPMILSLPLVLFLLDVWPFRRTLSWPRIAEKIPFLALSCAGLAVTILAQRSAGAIQPLSIFTPLLRLENALITVFLYIADTFWPSRLSIAYPIHPWPAWEVVAAGTGIAAASAAVLRQLRNRPYLAVGWLWFLATLVPVIGLLQAGLQARADRFMYVPMVGLSVMFAWSAVDAVAQWPRICRWVWGLAAVACLAMGIGTSLQARYWKDSEVLFRHALEQDNNNYEVWNYLAKYYLGLTIEGHPERLPDAIWCYRNVIRVRPEIALSHSNLAGALLQEGRSQEALAEYRRALRMDPASGALHSNLATALAKLNRPDEAIDEFKTAVRLDPRLAVAYNSLGVLLSGMPGRSAEGLHDLERATEIAPDYAQAQANLGLALLKIPGRLPEAVTHFSEALRVDPGLVAAHVGLASVLIHVPGMEAEAIAHLEAAQRLQPNAELRKTIDRLAPDHMLPK